MNGTPLAVLSLMVSCVVASIGGYQAYIYKGQLEIAKDQEVRQFRAYVGSTNMQLVKVSGTDHLYLQITFHNYGITPASVFSYIWHSDTELKNARSSYGNAQNDIDPNYGNSVFPGSDQSWTTDFNINQFPEEFTQDRRIVTFYGTMFYHDVFGVSHSARFCYLITHENFASLAKNGSPIFPNKCVGSEDSS